MLELVTPENVTLSSSAPIQFFPILDNLVDNYAHSTLVPYAAYDIGSGGTKFMGALINPETLKIEEVFSQGSLPVAYQADLNQSPHHEFSDFIQELGLNALSQAKTQIEQDFHAKANFQQYGEIQHFAVATAAFRVAVNGEAVADYFTQNLNIPISIISQDQEGELAYYGATSKIDSKTFAEAPVVWDIGGGSMQFTYKDVNESFHIFKGALASQTFQTLVATEISANPMQEKDIAAALELVKGQLSLHSDVKDFIHSKIKNDIPVIAVGSVHNLSIQPLCHMAGMHQATDYYTKEDLRYAINLLTDKTDLEITKISNLTNIDLAKNQLTNLLLVYAMMDMMGIEKVHTIKSSNIEGLLTLPQSGLIT